ncbi:MAG: helix-turn-helix domain-containing protein [Chloroflexi bacterium]|nr:helix-turn-helix domain-containing protein [Chloroflexota bacterium]
MSKENPPPDPASLDPRERRRLRAWDLYQQGWSQRRIAAELGVTQGAVHQWLSRARAGGTAALRRRTAPGPAAALTDAQFAQIPALLARGAEAFGFQGDYWTTRRAAAALEQVFGVAYHPSHVSRLLRQYAPGWRDRFPKR